MKGREGAHHIKHTSLAEAARTICETDRLSPAASQESIGGNSAPAFSPQKLSA
jgi:hypothetical protein